MRKWNKVLSLSLAFCMLLSMTTCSREKAVQFSDEATAYAAEVELRFAENDGGETPEDDPPAIAAPVPVTPLPTVLPEPTAEETLTNPTPPATPAPTPAPMHSHNWTAITETVHHDAVTRENKVIDQEAAEGYYKGGSYEVMVCRCGEEFTSYDAWLSHAHAGGMDGHGGFTGSVRSNQVWVEGTPEVSHYETVIVQEAWDEEVITGYMCGSCGAVK